MLFKNITMIDPKIQAKEKMNIGIEEDNIVYIGEDVPEKDYAVSGKRPGRSAVPARADSALLPGFCRAPRPSKIGRASCRERV